MLNQTIFLFIGPKTMLIERTLYKFNYVLSSTSTIMLLQQIPTTCSITFCRYNSYSFDFVTYNRTHKDDNIIKFIATDFFTVQQCKLWK